MSPTEITARIQKAIDVAKGPQTELVTKTTASPETENITTELTVCFAENSLNGEVDISRLLNDLSGDAAMETITLNGPPDHRLVVHGSFATKLFKIVFLLARK
jgi:hypothetical protein